MCRTGNLSPLSVPTLKALGYQSVAVLQGGYNTWQAAELPTEQGLGEHSGNAAYEQLAIEEVGLFGSGPVWLQPRTHGQISAR